MTAPDPLREALTALTYQSDDGTEYEHTEGCEGEAECPGCWAQDIRALLDAHPAPEGDRTRALLAQADRLHFFLIGDLLAALGITDDLTDEQVAALLDGCDCSGEEGSRHLLWHIVQQRDTALALIAARQAPTVALDVETVARVQGAHRLRWLTIGSPDGCHGCDWAPSAQQMDGDDLVAEHARHLAAAVVAADPRRTEAQVKAEALREAAFAAVSEDEGIPWDHDYDRATVGAWLDEYAERIGGE